MAAVAEVRVWVASVENICACLPKRLLGLIDLRRFRHRRKGSSFAVDHEKEGRWTANPASCPLTMIWPVAPVAEKECQRRDARHGDAGIRHGDRSASVARVTGMTVVTETECTHVPSSRLTQVDGALWLAITSSSKSISEFVWVRPHQRR